MAVEIKVDERQDTKKSTAKKLRDNGSIPSIVYGKTLPPVTISVSEKEFLALMRKDPNTIIDLDVPHQGKSKVMVNEMQRDKLTRDILHIDFLQVDMKREITANVRLDFTGEPVGVKQEDGILQTETIDVEIQCLPDEIPAQLEVDINDLNVGDSLSAGDIKLPDGVKLITDSKEIIVTVLPPQKEVEEPEPSEGEEAADAPAEGDSAEGQDTEAADDAEVKE